MLATSVCLPDKIVETKEQVNQIKPKKLILELNLEFNSIVLALVTITYVVTINTLSEEKLTWQPQYTYSEKYGQTYVRSATTQ